MQSERKETKSVYIENDQAFVQSFVALLGELRDNVPKKTSLDTIRQLLVSHGQKATRMELVLAQLSNNILQHQLKTKRGPIKVISLMASVYQGELLPFFTGIVDLIIRKLKENDEELHESLSEATGGLIQFGLKDATEDVACEHLQTTLTKLFQLCGTGHRHTQTGASKCVVKAIQNISPFHLPMLLKEICANLFKLLRSSNCKNHFQLLESVLNVLIVYQGHPRKLEESANLLIPAIYANLHHKEGHVRKMAIEVMSTISHLLPEVAAPYKDELLKKLNLSRYDVVKAVREISLQAIKIVEKLPHCDEMIHPSELLLDQKHEDDSNVDIQDQSGYDENKRSRSQGKSFELSPPRLTANQPGQHQTPQKNKETPRPSSARQSPTSLRPKSTDGRKSLKKNTNFFEANQQKKEIDFIVKSPTKVNSSRITKKEKEPNLQIFYSPDKTYKYVYSDSNSPAARKKNNGSKSPSSLSKKSPTTGRIFSPYTIKDVKEAEEVDEISNPEGEENTKNSSQIHRDIDLSQGEKDEVRDESFKNLISQLVTVNQKQSKVKKVIKDFQATTHNEIMQLVDKINDIESAVLNKSRGSGNSSPSKSRGSGNSSPSNVEYECKSQQGAEQGSDEIKIEAEVKVKEEKAEEPETKEEKGLEVEAKEKKEAESEVKVEKEGNPEVKEEKVEEPEVNEEKVEEAEVQQEKEEDEVQIKIDSLFKENQINASFEFCLNEGSDKHLLKLVEVTEKLLAKMREIIDHGESEEGKDLLPCVIKVLQKYFELSSQVTAIYEKMLKKYGDKAKIDNVDIQHEKEINEKFDAIVDGLGEDKNESPEDLM